MISKFDINFNISFIVTYPKILKIDDYTEMLEKQLSDIKIIKNNCERFSKMEGYNTIFYQEEAFYSV